MSPRGAAPAWTALLASGLAAGPLALGCSTDASAAPPASSPDASTDAPAPTCAVDCSTIAPPPCEVAQCNTATGQCGLVPSPDDSPCDDGLYCTIGEKCKAGKCSGQANDCGLTAPACEYVSCDETSKSCALSPQADGTACDGATGDVCTLSGVCQQGACAAQPKSCDFEPAPDACHVAQCNPQSGACDVYVAGNDGAACSSDPCMIGATCAGGQCTGGTTQTCSAWADACNTATCDAAHNGCYAKTVNAGGGCDVHDPCNTGTCSATGQCVMAPAHDGAACSDGLPCTTNDACASGVCVGSGGPMVYFSDTFASNARGWTGDHPWQIGPTQQGFANCSPGSDHTRFGDNGVAATPLGGGDGYAVHDFAYLTSPVIDTSGASTLVLEFWQLIQWNPPPWGEAVVEVWNGFVWTRVWENQQQLQGRCDDPNTYLPAWQNVRIDLSPYAGQGMMIRFGIAAHVVDLLAGWTVDDVSITSTSCP
jgi:hypothetical protein